MCGYIFLLVVLGFGSATGKTGIRKLEKLNVDPRSVTVTGFSSGGAQAMQFHLAHSSRILGAGIFSGVPYLYGFGRKREDFFVNDIERFNTTEAIHATETYSIVGAIDPVEYLKNSKVYVYHGNRDSTEAVLPLKTFTNILDPPCCVTSTFWRPTDNYGGPCGRLNLANYMVNNCKYNGVYEMYNHLYGGNLTQPLMGSVGTVPIKGEFYYFDQSEFYVWGTPHSMDKVGFVYVPSECAKKSCRLSFVFHGCLQNRQYFGDKFPRTTGYLEVAELNNIIQVYPQTARSTGTPRNPSGCWDWMGFTGEEYREL
ncbi:hypothetical protein Ocin01_06257 [Orchesella cincta]|uniref:Uncharacterized protein n=1 Tax=Orchesella cincta TaxID=48709 RepID=A0A1D2N5D0_ORCCI|nr:hypothetical protein Ocin01_06257 [Orchesella cincta]